MWTLSFYSELSTLLPKCGLVVDKLDILVLVLSHVIDMCINPVSFFIKDKFSEVPYLHLSDLH